MRLLTYQIVSRKTYKIIEMKLRLKPLLMCSKAPVDGVIRCHRNGQFSTHSWSAASIAIRISQYICLHEITYYEDQTADLKSIQHADFRS